MASVLVIGAGQMGGGIAQVLAVGGHRVWLVDSEPGRAQAAKERIGRRLEKDSPDATNVVLAQISVLPHWREADAPDLVIEAVVENAGVKRELFSALDRHFPASTRLASNTSSISITVLGAATARPERVVGLHFMNPPPRMPLVEIVVGMRTGAATIRFAEELVTQLGKTPVRAQDSPGFIANRILMPMINEAIFTLGEGVAGAEAIDTVMRLGMRHPMGPLALADFIGLDTCLAILEVLQAEIGDPKYRPAPLLKKMVAAGRLGRKSGAGFYDYAAGEPEKGISAPMENSKQNKDR